MTRTSPLSQAFDDAGSTISSGSQTSSVSPPELLTFVRVKESRRLGSPAGAPTSRPVRIGAGWMSLTAAVVSAGRRRPSPWPRVLDRPHTERWAPHPVGGWPRDSIRSGQIRFERRCTRRRRLGHRRRQRAPDVRRFDSLVAAQTRSRDSQGRARRLGAASATTSLPARGRPRSRKRDQRRGTRSRPNE